MKYWSESKKFSRISVLGVGWRVSGLHKSSQKNSSTEAPVSPRYLLPEWEDEGMTERRVARRYDLSLPIIVRVPAERAPRFT